MGDVAPATTPGGTKSALAIPDQMSLDGLAGKLGDRYAPTLGFVAEPRVEVIRELDRGPFHGMPAYLPRQRFEQPGSLLSSGRRRAGAPISARSENARFGRRCPRDLQTGARVLRCETRT